MTERFRELAEATRRSRGIPEAPFVILPRTEETEYGGSGAMNAAAEEALRGVVELIGPGAPVGGRAR